MLGAVILPGPALHVISSPNRHMDYSNAVISCTGSQVERPILAVLSPVLHQARTSTICPLKISSAFWISGSFLKSSLLKGTGDRRSFAGGDETGSGLGNGG